MDEIQDVWLFLVVCSRWSLGHNQGWLALARKGITMINHLDLSAYFSSMTWKKTNHLEMYLSFSLLGVLVGIPVLQIRHIKDLKRSFFHNSTYFKDYILSDQPVFVTIITFIKKTSILAALTLSEIPARDLSSLQHPFQPLHFGQWRGICNGVLKAKIKNKKIIMSKKKSSSTIIKIKPKWVNWELLANSQLLLETTFLSIFCAYNL